MSITLTITVETPIELQNHIMRLAATSEPLTGEATTNTTNTTARRGRPPKTAGTEAATSAPANDPLDMGGGKSNGAADPDLMDAPTTKAPEPKYKTPEDFINGVKALLGKGKDDAVRGRLKELGFEKVRDVPADKYESTIAELAKV